MTELKLKTGKSVAALLEIKSSPVRAGWKSLHSVILTTIVGPEVSVYSKG